MTQDQTWYRIVIFSPAPRLYYRHPEHGGPVDDVLHADFFRQADVALGSAMTAARKHYPSGDWQYARFNYTLDAFESPVLISTLITEDIKRQALAKLSPEERQVLGLNRS